ncbi:MAG: MATE family efflux transporter [Solobacterium sp.]|nr:MATE family efflux transporter [Solobacterium sp.]
MSITELKNRYLGPKEFYGKTARIAIPLALQSMLMSAQSTIDTLMVSWIGMVSAVGTAAQIDILCGNINFGFMGGIGMFSAQFFGAKDYRNLKRCMGFCLLLAIGNGLVWFLLASLFGRQILTFYIKDPEVIHYGLQYLSISRFNLIISAIGFGFSTMYRNTQQPKTALKVSIFTSLLNVSLNALLIFGLGPIPSLGVRGAALATVIANCVSGIVLCTHAFVTKQPFVGSFKEMFSLDRNFVVPILGKMWPLMVNETIFGFGQTLFVKAFGQLGKVQMDAYYIGNQIFNLSTFIIFGYGNAIQILLGTSLGKGKIEEALQECRYHLGLGGVISAVLVVLLMTLARPLVYVFHVTDPLTMNLAVKIIYVFAVKVSLRMFNFMIFCILRSGGDAKIIQFLDAGLEWMVGLTSAFACVNLFHMKNIALVLLVTQLEQLVRMILGMHRVRQNIWAEDLTKLVTE